MIHQIQAKITGSNVWLLPAILFFNFHYMSKILNILDSVCRADWRLFPFVGLEKVCDNPWHSWHPLPEQM